MAWKKDLAKLKQDLGKEEAVPGKVAPPPKARTAHPVSKSIEEEDNIFLSAMGLRPKPEVREAPAALRDEPPAVIQPKPAPLASKVEFSVAMGDLKGLKPMSPTIPQAQPAPAAPAPPAPEALAAPVPPPLPEPPPAPEPEPEAKPAGPAAPPQVQIHLAAGMAIVVDGSLDLKGHARRDAEERLKERILDGYALGWRTLHVVVGASAELRQMVLDLLMSPAGHCVARYAQAPVPMGGPQAWILYFKGPGAPEN
jgi:DNA-nicking Smr family endonuclease